MTRARRVLLVEDNISNVRMLEAKLAERGFEVEVALDGLQALSKLKARPFDLILLDVMLPGLDGFEICRRIKRGRRSPDAPVVIITALDSDADRQAGLAAGADDYFVKPVEDEVLFPRVSDLVSHRQREAVG